MKHRTRLAVFGLLAAAVVISSVQPLRFAQSQGGEPRFSFPSARRFAITSYFDHTHPDVLYNTIDDEIAAYTTERGLRSNICFDYVAVSMGIELSRHHGSHVTLQAFQALVAEYHDLLAPGAPSYGPVEGPGEPYRAGHFDNRPR